MTIDSNDRRTRRRGTPAALLAVAAMATVLISGCSRGDDADAIPAYTGAPTTTATPSQSAEEAAEQAALAYYSTLRDLYRTAKADRERLSRVASGSAFNQRFKSLRHYDKENMPDNGKRTWKVLEVRPVGETVHVRVCYDMSKVRVLQPDGKWSVTLPVNVSEEELTVSRTADGWKVTALKPIFYGGCHK